MKLPLDKLLHFGIGAFIGARLFPFGWHIAFATVALAAVAKELYDRFVNHEQFDWIDVGATVAGGLTAIIVVVAVIRF